MPTPCQAAGPSKGQIKGGGKGHVKGGGKGDGKGDGKATGNGGTTLEDALAELELEMKKDAQGEDASDGSDIDMLLHEHRCNVCHFVGRPNDILLLDATDFQGGLTAVCCVCAVEKGHVKDATVFKRAVRHILSLAWTHMSLLVFWSSCVR